MNVFRNKWAVKSGNKRIKNISIEQLMTDCGAMINNELTFAALIMFGTNYSKFCLVIQEGRYRNYLVN